MAPRATRAGAPLADRQPHHHPRRPRRASRRSEKDARVGIGATGANATRASARGRRGWGIRAPGRPPAASPARDDPGRAREREGRSGVCQREKKPSSPRVFVKRTNAEMGVPDAPLGLLGELGLVHEVGARHAGEVLGDVHQAHRVGLRGWRSRPGWCAVVLSFRGRWHEAASTTCLAPAGLMNLCQPANHHFFSGSYGQTV